MYGIALVHRLAVLSLLADSLSAASTMFSVILSTAGWRGDCAGGGSKCGLIEDPWVLGIVLERRRN